LNLHTKKSSKNISHETHHIKNNLSGLGLDACIFVETREKLLSFVLGSSQIPGNFQNFTFNNSLANFTPPKS